MARRIDRIAPALAALAVAALAACHDLPDLGTCGNGIVEEGNGEACDDIGESATCKATCELKCLPDAGPAGYVDVGPNTAGEARFCPDARYRCGSDDICRAPSGEFGRPGPALPFDVGGPPQLVDVDNDGFSDLVGTSATDIYVRFSSTIGAPLESLVVQDAPSSDAPFAIFDLHPRGMNPTGGANTLVAIPTEGVSLLESSGAGFLPRIELPIALQLPDEPRGLVVRDPDPRYGEVVIAMQSRSTGPAILGGRVSAGPPGYADTVPAGPLQPCVGAAGGAWLLVSVQAAPDRRSFVVVTRREDTTQPAWHVCRYSHSGTGGWSLADFEVAGAPPSVAVLANLDADACLELVVRRTANPPLAMIDAAGATCSFSTTVTPVPIAEAAAMPGTPAASLYAAGQVVPGDVDELVLASGVYRQCTGLADCAGSPIGTFVRAIAPTKVPWVAAAVVDLNRDGVLDVVAGRAGEPDVDVVRGGAVLNVYRANTSAPVSALVAGDYDGDRIGDVALVETAGTRDRVSVLFGTLESIVPAPVPMTPLLDKLRIDRLGEINWLPSSHGHDGVDDLVVVDSVGGTVRAGVMLGDAARLMTAPRFPPSPTSTPLSGVIAGAFGGVGVKLLTISPSQVQLYEIPPTNAPTMMEWGDPIALPANVSFAPPLTLLRAEAGDARGAATANMRDVMLFSVRGATLTSCKATPAARPAEVYGIDLDNDGIDHLAVVSQDLSPGAAGPRMLEVFDAQCNPVPGIAEAIAGCTEIVNVSGRLLALCASGAGDGRGVFEIAGEGGTFARGKQVAALDSEGRFLAAGDFDGDGVLDVAVGVNRGGIAHVELMRQCPAHDTRACRP